MKMNREQRRGGVEGSLVELGEKRMRIADRQFNSVVYTEKLKLFTRKFKHIYCKYLHGE